MPLDVASRQIRVLIVDDHALVRSVLRSRLEADKDIDLFISARTVDTHRAHIMRKLDLTTRAELVLYSLSHGLIGPS